MWRKSVLPALSLLLLLNRLALRAEASGRRGALMISGAGGASRESFGTGVLEQFVTLAGGPEANFVYIPTASSGIKLDMARGHERGFGFLKNVAINPHLITAKREDELVNVLDAHPELLGIGIDERAAILVRGREFRVLGDSKVAIYDDRRHGNRWYYWLDPGTVFDLRTRAVLTQKAPGQ